MSIFSAAVQINSGRTAGDIVGVASGALLAGYGREMELEADELGAEYLYQDSFALRAGYFSENESKGARKFFALGAGFKYTTIDIDLSYLFSASKVQSPLENTLRFSLSFNIGDDEYSEY